MQVGAKEILQVSQGIPTNLLSEIRESTNVHYQFGMCSFPVLIYGILTVLIIGAGAVIWCHKKHVYKPDTNHPNKLPLLVDTDVKVYPLPYPVQLDQHDPAYLSKIKDPS